VVLEIGRRRGRSQSSDLAGVPGRGSGWGGSRVRLGPIWVLTCDGETSGGRGRQSRAACAAGVQAAASLGVGLGKQ
jgi:hypothetical protein